MSKLASFALVLALVGCSKKSQSGGADGDPCTAPINKAIDTMIGAGGADMKEQMKAFADKLRGIYVSACQTDKWPADVLSCFSAAGDQPSIKKCRQMLPPEQAQRVQQQIMAVMAGAGGPGGPGGGMGPMHGGGGAPPAPPSGGTEPPPPAGSAAPPPAGSGS